MGREEKLYVTFLVIIGAVAAQNGFHEDLETSLKAYFGQISSNETTGNKLEIPEDDRWKRSPIYAATLPTYVADQYNEDSMAKKYAEATMTGQPGTSYHGNPRKRGVTKKKKILKKSKKVYRKKTAKGKYSKNNKRRGFGRSAALDGYIEEEGMPGREYDPPAQRVKYLDAGQKANENGYRNPTREPGYRPSARKPTYVPKTYPSYVPTREGERGEAAASGYGPSSQYNGYKEGSQNPPRRQFNGRYEQYPMKDSYGCPNGRCSEIRNGPPYRPQPPSRSNPDNKPSYKGYEPEDPVYPYPHDCSSTSAEPHEPNYDEPAPPQETSYGLGYEPEPEVTGNVDGGDAEQPYSPAYNPEEDATTTSNPDAHEEHVAPIYSDSDSYGPVQAPNHDENPYSNPQQEEEPYGVEPPDNKYYKPENRYEPVPRRKQKPTAPLRYKVRTTKRNPDMRTSGYSNDGYRHPDGNQYSSTSYDYDYAAFERRSKRDEGSSTPLEDSASETEETTARQGETMSSSGNSGSSEDNHEYDSEP